MANRLFWTGAPVALGIWFLGNTFHALLIYGMRSGMALWFCNLGLAGIAIGIAVKNRSLLLALVSGLCFTQTVWLLDNTWRIVSGSNLFGLAEFLYHPGLAPSVYLLSSYHFFALPCALYALYLLGPAKKDYSHWSILGIGIPLFALSYFPFTADHNVNCARESCFSFINRWDNTWEYTVVFATLCIAFALGFSRLWVRLFRRWVRTPERDRRAKRWLLLTCGISAGLVLWGTIYQSRLPKFSCAEPTEDSQARIQCLYTMEYDTRIFLLQYQVANKTEVPLACNTKMTISGETQLMHQDVYVKPGQQVPIAVLLAYPSEDVEARLTAACGERDGNP